ncbi:NCS2 family permease [Bacillota bacterium LX-D]|nr:NCS2 family permease [Bacillota bacterium LX-D]
MLERIFKLRANDTTVRTEILAGFTTFITLAYIIFVNPAILADAGIPKEAAIAATIYATVVSTLLMGLWANFPIAVAPGMGLNAFFTYTVVLGMGLSWQTALGAVFISGIVFLILTVTKIRQYIIEGVPSVLRSSIGVGIGLFIAFIGLKNAGIVVADEATFVKMGDITNPGVYVSLIGLVIAAILMTRKIKGSILISILITTILAMITGVQKLPASIGDIVSFNVPSLAPTFLQLDLAGAIHYGIFSIIFSFTIVELFDNIGTLIGLTKKAGMMDQDGKINNIDRALTTDSIGTMTSALFGTSTVTSYIESAAGIAEGGRTGLTAVTVAVLFLISLLFSPLIGLIPSVATAPALIIVGTLMLGEIANVKFEDFTEIFPAFLTIIMMPLTYSIATGLAFGFISYTLIKLFTGKAKEVSIMMYIISIAFLINFVLR